MQRFAEVGPLEGLGHGAVEIGDEVQHLVPEVGDGSEVATPQQLTDQDTEPDLDLIQPRRMLGRVVKDDLVGWIGQESSAGRHRLQNAAFPFGAQVVGDARDLRHVAHQTLRTGPTGGLKSSLAKRCKRTLT